jgi:CubicO group peptidase (beta-lactamase class C family)
LVTLFEKQFVRGLSLILTALLFFAQCKKEETPPSGPPEFTHLEEEIDYLVEPFLHVGMVVGVIDKNQVKRVFAFGTKSTTTEEPPDEHTVFEIGSINKSFTCLIAAKNILDGTFENDTVQHYLPDDRVLLPDWNGVPVTLHSLLTHTSGIPRKPTDDGYDPPSGYNSKNPYATYTTDYMYAYLNDHCELLFEPGTAWEYSNSGMGLVGHIIGLADSSDYETVLHREVFDVLGMGSSALFLTEEQKMNFAIGYDRNLAALPEFTAQDIMQGAGFIKSSVADMFKYLEAQMGLEDTPLKPAIDYCHQPQLELEYWGQQCIGWYRKVLDDGQQITYCGGNTIGFGSYLGFNESLSTGVILWYNADFDDGANLILGPQILQAISKY